MKLHEYLESIINTNSPSNELPSTLELAPEVAKAFGALYARGESRKIELGHTLSYDTKLQKVLLSPQIQGSGHGISMKSGSRDLDFGNVHCHPGPSLGHIGGRAAHSPPDVMALEKELNKRVFIMFVSSGASTNYALVYRKGISTFNIGRVRFINQTTTKKLGAFFERNCPVTAQQRMDTNVCIARSTPKPGVTVNDLAEQYPIELKRVTPGFGKYAEQLSLENMNVLAREFKLGFYKSELTNASKLTLVRP